MQELVLVLKAIISPEQNDVTIYNVNDKKELEKYKSNSSSNKGTIDIYDELIDDESLNIEYKSGIIVEPKNSCSSSASNQATGSSINMGEIIMEPENSLSSTSTESPINMGGIIVEPENSLSSTSTESPINMGGIIVEPENSLSSTSTESLINMGGIIVEPENSLSS